jgi:hypothetical protein
MPNYIYTLFIDDQESDSLLHNEPNKEIMAWELFRQRGWSFPELSNAYITCDLVEEGFRVRYKKIIEGEMVINEPDLDSVRIAIMDGDVGNVLYETITNEEVEVKEIGCSCNTDQLYECRECEKLFCADCLSENIIVTIDGRALCKECE